VLFNLIVAATAGLWLARAYDENQEQAAVASRNMANVLAQSFTATVERIDVSLTTVVDSYVHHRGDPAEIERILRNLQKRLIGIDNVGMADASGEIQVLTPVGFPPHASIADRAYFQTLRDTPNAELIISSPVQGRVTGRWQIVLARRLTQPDGSFGGAVYAVIMIDRLAEMFSHLDLGPHGAVALRDLDFGLIARYPEPTGNYGAIGTKAMSNEFRAMLVTHPAEGTYLAKAGYDNIWRNVSYRITANRFYVIIGQASDDYLAHWRTDVVRVSGVALLVAALSLLLFRTLVRSWRQNEALWQETRTAKARIEDLSQLNTAVISASSIGVMVYRTDGSCILANAAAAHIGGGSIEQLMAQNFRDLSSWQATSMLAAAETALTTKSPRHVSTNFVSTFGRAFALDAELSRILIGGEPHLLVMFRDVTEQKRAEAMLREGEARYRGLVESQSDFVIRLDQKGCFVFANGAFAGALGLAAEAMLGKPCHLFIYPDDIAQTLTAITLASTGPHYRATIESRLLLAEGPRWVAWEGCGIRDMAGEVVEIQAVGRDITDWVENRDRLKELVRELDTSNKDLEQFAYVASHDLREPLRMVTSYLDLLARRYQDKLDTDAREFIAFARDGAMRMNHLILDLLEYSRIGRTGKPNEPVDLTAVVRQALGILSLPIDEADGRVDVAADLPQVIGNPDDLVRLFQNLIGNSLKYRSHDRAPVVTITAETQGADWLIKIADNGIGISPDYFERIFGVFQRLHGHGEYEGTGIGLANCKKIVEHHDGRIWVESRPGEGSIFCFTLPQVVAGT
jgi:PAS domain S-box-containing protein